MKKLVVFDLDGTLIDSVPDIADCVNVTLEKFGHEYCTCEEVAQMIGNGARNLIKAAVKCELSDADIDERLDFYSELYTNYDSPKTKVFDGIKETLEELKNRGYALAIFTNKPQGATDKIREIYLSEIDFYRVVGISPAVKRKPDPNEIFSMMKELSVSAENVYFVGDGEADVMVSKNAGINGISVLYGYRTKAQLQKVGATVFVDTPIELLEILK